MLIYPDIEDRGRDTNGLIVVSDYDRAFLLALIQERLFPNLTDEQAAYVADLENRIMADRITELIERIADATEALEAEVGNAADSIERVAVALETMSAGEGLEDISDAITALLPLLAAL